MTPSRSRFLNLDTTDISHGIILFLNHFFYIKNLFISGCLGEGAALCCGGQASHPLVAEHRL